MNSRGLKFQEALSQDRNSLFAAPAPSGSVPPVEASSSTAKTRRELLWEQKKLARQSKSFGEQIPQKQVSFSQAPGAVDPTTLPPPPFQEEMKPKSRGTLMPGDDFQSLTDTGGSTMNRELADMFQKPPSYQQYGEVPLEFQEAQKLAPAPPSRDQFQRAEEIVRQPPPQETLPSKVSAAPPSGNIAKQQYLKELQEQMELKRAKERQDKQRKIAEEKQKLQEMDRFAPWGANARHQGPGGIARRDDLGNAPRAPPAISNPYSSYAQGPPPAQMYQQPAPPAQFASVQSQPNLLPPTMVDHNYRPPLSPQVNSTYTHIPQHNSSQSVGQPQILGPPGGMNNLVTAGGGIIAQAPPPQYNSFPQQVAYNQAMIPQAGIRQSVGFNPAQEYGMQAPQIALNLPSSVRKTITIQDQQMNGQLRDMQKFQYPQSAERVPPQEVGAQPRIERRSKTPLGGAGASTLQSKYVTKVVDEGEEAKKRRQQQEYQELLVQQIEERKRKKREEEQARQEEERKQEEKLERERIQLEEEFKREQELKKKKKNEVDEFNAQKWTEHKVVSKNPKAAAKRREAQLFAQKEREERSKADLFAPAQPKREEINFVAPTQTERRAELFEQKKREALSETQIIENVSKQIRGNLDRELEQLRGEMNKKDHNFNQEVNKLKMEAQRAEEEKRRSQQELEQLKKQLQENKFRDIKYQHDLAQALRKTEAPPQAQFVAKPTSELLPIGVQPQPNLLPPQIKGGFEQRYPVHDMGQTGTLHTLKHESQLIPMNAGDRTLNVALQPGPPVGLGPQIQAPKIVSNGPLHHQAEMSMSLDNTTRNIQIPEIGARSLRDASDSFPSIPDVNQYGKATVGGGQTLDGFTVNSINLQKMNQKNRERLAGLQGQGNLSYKPSDPKDELAKLDQLLFNILHSDQPGKSRPATQDRKQQAVNFEEEVRGMINEQQAGAGRGVHHSNPDHSLRSLQAQDIQYKQQMAEILNPAQHSFKPITPQQRQSAEASLNIDSFIMPDSTQRLEPLRMQQDDSLQGINTLSLQGGKYLPNRQQTGSSMGGLRGQERELYSIEEDPLEGSLKVNRE